MVRRLIALSEPGAASIRNLLDTLRAENIGAVLLLLAAALGLGLANSAAAPVFEAVAGTTFGPASVHLDLTVSEWATDGLLAIFFFVVGLELKRELVVGDLRRPAHAVVPVVAAVGGVLVPAVIYLLVNAQHPAGTAQGWVVPTATDIAFAVALFSVFGRGLPIALRLFLLTLAVVDDLIGIGIIAVVFSDGIDVGALGVAALAAFGFAAAARWERSRAVVMVPLALVVWAATHASGVHATIAGCVLGLLVPVRPLLGETQGLAERFEHRWRPAAALVAAPVFAVFAAAIPLSDVGLAASVRNPVVWGIVLGLVLGKPVGIFLATLAVVRFTRARLADDVRWADVAAVGAAAGVGFTVALLMAELSFGVDSAPARLAVIVGTTLAVVVGGAMLAWRGARHRALPTRRAMPVPVAAGPPAPSSNAPTP